MKQIRLALITSAQMALMLVLMMYCGFAMFGGCVYAQSTDGPNELGAAAMTIVPLLLFPFVSTVVCAALDWLQSKAEETHE